MPIYSNRAFYVFLATLVAFVLLTLTTISVPLVSTLSFLHSSQANGVSFGMWGWCLDDGMTCSPTQFGYTWPPEITTSITKAFVFYPIAIVLAFFTMVSAVPTVCARSVQSDKIFDVFAWVSFGTSAIAFFFMIGICGVAKSRFEQRGFSANYGNLPWMSLVATILLFIVSLRRYYLAPPPKQNSRRSIAADIESRLSAMIPERWSKGKKRSAEVGKV
ncbi:hypothetical protein BJ912DRAFT_997279 [Pholiota molesta]|nr:hypothetical protein BJ912DRAFT_997279 [Pholiota molesta]